MKNRIKKIISRLKFSLDSLYYSFFLTVFSIFPVKKNRVIFFNFAGKGYGDNGKSIAEEILAKSGSQLDLYWTAKPQYENSIPDGIKYTKYISPITLLRMATAHVWVNNKRFHYGIKKRNQQLYIQTWHSSLRLKKIEQDAESTLSKQYIKSAKNDSKMIDIFTSGCTFSTQLYRRAFWYDGEVLECGTPRMDLFFDVSKRQSIRRKISQLYNLDKHKINILYAPTFKHFSDEKSYLNARHLLKMLGEQYNILVRMHPNSKYKYPSEEGIIDVTHYPDMQELFCAADLLITDYSSCCFDALINHIPCILFVTDLDKYLAKERNLYFTFEDLPFPCAKTESELTDYIQDFDEKEYNSRIEHFSKTVGLHEEGIASKVIANIIINKCKGE